MVKNLPANAGDAGDVRTIPSSGGFPGMGNDNPFQYPCLEDSVDRGSWRAIVHKVAKSHTQLSD